MIKFFSFNIQCNFEKQVESALIGLAIGDALGVPVEFMSREYLQKKPVKDMLAFGTHYQPVGTFSDDSSLTFCLAESLTSGFDLNIIAHNFIKWYQNAYWTATGEVFDIGKGTREAIHNLIDGCQPDLAGGYEESNNGNGSLMRILPLVFYLKNKPLYERFQLIKKVSSITHQHIRSVMACFYYLEFAYKLLEKKDKFTIYNQLKNEVSTYFESLALNPNEISKFDRLLKHNIYELNENDIQSSGYVVHTLEASIWCIMTTSNYKEAVLKAVNLGNDTDTTASVTGGLAGLIYGIENIPQQWIKQLACKNEIIDLAKRLTKKLVDNKPSQY